MSYIYTTRRHALNDFFAPQTISYKSPKNVHRNALARKKALLLKKTEKQRELKAERAAVHAAQRKRQAEQAEERKLQAQKLAEERKEQEELLLEQWRQEKIRKKAEELRKTAAGEGVFEEDEGGVFVLSCDRICRYKSEVSVVF